MNDRGLLARLRYEFDKTMAAGTIAMIAWLFLLSIAVVALAAALIAIAGIQPADGERMTFVEGFWQSLMRTLDPGTMGDDQGWPFRLLMLAVTLTGVFIVATLVGVIITGLVGKLEQLRKGRSLVLEENHTIVFNWSETIFDVISQLVIANESRWRPSIVIMADRDKVEMEDEIAAQVRDRRNSRIICRSGDPTDLYDIGIVNPRTCRSVVVLSPAGPHSDACVIKTILALVTDPERRKRPYRIAAEIRDRANAEVARAVGGSEVQLVRADDLISKIIVRSTRQPGLSAVYTELLDFEGCEIYAVEQPELEGMNFGEAILHYEICSLAGLCGADGEVVLNPPMDSVIGAGSRLLLIAEDDERIETAPPPEVAAEPLPSPSPPVARSAERTLLIGWNRRAPIIIRELSRYVGPGSIVTVAADTPTIEQELERLETVGDSVTVELKRIDTMRRTEIEALDPVSYDHVLLVGYTDTMDVGTADTRTLVTLLHLREIRDEANERVDVVSELGDVRNVGLAELTRVDDFVVSNKLVSLMLTQASENRYFEAIFRDLLDDRGSEIALRSASDYVPLGQEVDFYTVVRAASARGETAIGHSTAGGPGTGIQINPIKSRATCYGQADRIIVLARD